MILEKASDLSYIPKRIISLVPSQTELLSSLGLETETFGITKFCVHPRSWFQTKQRVGGTKTVNMEKIHQLQPDLVIANKEENVKEQIEELALHYPVWVSDVNNLQDALKMINDIGTLSGKQKEANTITVSINEGFTNLEKLKTQNSELKTAYLIWRKPYMTVGGDTFIHDMLSRCGFINIFGYKERYPEIDVAQLPTAGCQLLLLSSEPYPFRQKHIDELQSSLPNTKIMLADGEFFSWYGSRLLEAPRYFNELIKKVNAVIS